MDVPQNTSGKKMAEILLKRWGRRFAHKIRRTLNMQVAGNLDFKQRDRRSGSVIAAKWIAEKEEFDSLKSNAFPRLQPTALEKLQKSVRKVKVVNSLVSADPENCGDKLPEAGPRSAKFRKATRQVQMVQSLAASGD